MNEGWIMGLNGRPAEMLALSYLAVQQQVLISEITQKCSLV